MYSLFHYEQSHIQNFLKYLEFGICSFVSCLSHSPFLTQILDIHELVSALGVIPQEDWGVLWLLGCNCVYVDRWLHDEDVESKIQFSSLWSGSEVLVLLQWSQICLSENLRQGWLCRESHYLEDKKKSAPGILKSLER